MDAIASTSRIVAIVALAVGVLLDTSSAARRPVRADHQSVLKSSEMGAQSASSSDTFPCSSKNSQMPTAEGPRSRHTVTLSWNVSVSLATPLAVGEGYNVYRLNPDDSCTKINGSVLISGTTAQDPAVELGKTYSYGVRALQQNVESNSSNVVVVKIPPD